MVAVQMPEPKEINSEKAVRLNTLCTKLADSQTEFANRLGINQSNLGKMIRGERVIGPNMVRLITNLLNVNPEWWETGQGDMFIDPKATLYPAPYVGRIMATDLVEVRFLSMKNTTISVKQLINDPASLPTIPVRAHQIVGELADNVVIEVSGDSMDPRIMDGAIVTTLRVAPGKFAYAPSPAIYIVAHQNRLIIGRMTQNDLPLSNSLTLYPDNPVHDPVTIPASQIQAMYRVHHVEQNIRL